MKAAAKLAVPTPPEGYFFRVKPVYNPFASPGTINVQLRKRVGLVSVVEGERWAFPEGDPVRMEAAILRRAEGLLGDLQRRLRRRESTDAISRFYGDHP